MPLFRRHRAEGFSLVELLVVIGIIAILIALLMPTLSRARDKAKCIQCMSNMRQVGIQLNIYCNDNRGWLFPAQPGFGTDVPPHLRWPMVVFKIPGAPIPPPYQSVIGTYDPNVYNPVVFDPKPYTPPILVCPSDVDPKEGHSYILNSHVAYKGVKAGTLNLGGKTASEVIVMGEKVSSEGDYFMELTPGSTGGAPGTSEFDRLVDIFRHGFGFTNDPGSMARANGKRVGSNYLFLDWHVDTLVPEAAKSAVDPWDLP